MKVEEALAIYWRQIQKRKEKKKRNRMYWIHTILTNWSEKKLFATLYADLRVNPDNFFLFARMSASSFDELMPNPIYAKLMPLRQISNFHSNLNLENKSFNINFYVISFHDYWSRNNVT